MPSFRHRVRMNWSDARAFGPAVLLRHWSRVRGRPDHRWYLPGVGRIGVRHGSTDIQVLRQVFEDREYDISRFVQSRRVTVRYEALLAVGDTPVIIDAGANIGASALWFAREYPLARVLSVEPDAGNAACCRANIAGRPAITLYEAAIGGMPGRIVMDDVWGGAWALRSRRSENGGVPVITIPELVASVPRGRLFIAKIDIEGFESDLFQGDLSWIDDTAAIMIETHDWMRAGEGTSFALQKAMGERRFELVIRGENLIYFNSADAGHG